MAEWVEVEYNGKQYKAEYSLDEGKVTVYGRLGGNSYTKDIDTEDPQLVAEALLIDMVDAGQVEPLPD